MSWLPTVLGAVLVLGVLRDVFHTLFHPAGRGEPAVAVFKIVWAVTGRIGRRARALAGPVGMVSVIGLWTLLLIVGWALVYWPAMPEGFIFASDLDSDRQDGLGDAMYVSAVTQATLGYGDIAPEDAVFRALAPLQAVLGFAVFTAGVTWVLSVYPALQRQRATASLAGAICKAAEGTDGRTHDAVAARRMERLVEAISACRVDIVQFPSTFYFAAPDATLSLAEVLPDVRRLAVGAAGPQAEAAAHELEAAVDALAATLGENLPAAGAGTDAVIDAYRAHHAASDHGGRA